MRAASWLTVQCLCFLMCFLMIGGCSLLPQKEVPLPPDDDGGMTADDGGTADGGGPARDGGGPTGCSGPAECPKDRPVCDKSTTPALCVGCLQRSDCPGGMVCDPGTKKCGACAGEALCATGEACVAGRCGACTRHDDCASKVCDLFNLTGAGAPGACIAESQVIYVDNSVATALCGVYTGERAKPLCAIEPALDRLSAGKVIRVLPGSAPYGLPNLTDTTRPILLYGPAAPCLGTECPAPGPGALVAKPGFDTLSITGTAGMRDVNVTIDGFLIAPTLGLTCRNAKLTLRRSQVLNTQAGIKVESSLLTLQGVLYQANSGILELSNTDYAITNSFFLINSVPAGKALLSMINSTAGTFTGNTMAGNYVIGMGGGYAISCNAGNLIANSIVVNNPFDMSATQFKNCTFSGDVVGDDGSNASGLIKKIPDFADPNIHANYRLADTPQNRMNIINKVDCKGLTRDYFGTRRPQRVLCDIGAHELPGP